MHILRCNSVCVRHHMLPVDCILSVAEGDIIHQLLCGRLRVESGQGINQLVPLVHGWEGIHPGDGCLLGSVNLEQTQCRERCSIVSMTLCYGCRVMSRAAL